MTSRTNGPPDVEAARSLAGETGRGETDENQHHDSAAAARPPASEDEARARVAAVDKRVADLVARAALAGWVCHVIEGEGYAFHRWGYVAVVAGLDAAEAWLRRATGGKA